MLKKTWFFLLLVVVLSFFSFRLLLKPGYFSMHDDLQIGRLYQMDLCFRDGQIPCRWVPDMGYSYGYPLFNYYPPFPYYLGEAVHVLGFSFIDTTKILFILGFLVSGILMYLFTRKLWGDWGGLLSSVLYIYAPYHSVDVYVRGAMNEFWALAFLPGVFWAAYEVVDRKDRKYLPVFALFFGLLLLSHNLMAFIFAPVIGIFSLLLIWVKKKKLTEKIKDLILGGIWGLGMAAFFTLPVIFEKKYAHVETMLMGYFNYLAHYVPIGKLLFTRYWGYGSSGWLQDAGMPFQVGFPHWPLAVFVLLIYSFLFFRKKVSKENFFLVLFFSFVFVFTLFLTHPRSVFIWNAIGYFAYLQFPWRFLTLVIFSISILGGGIIYLLSRKFTQVLCSLVLVISIILLNYSFFKVEKTFQVTDEQKLFSAKGWNKLQTDAIFDYLPVYAKAPPGGPAPAKPEIKEGVAETSEIEKGTNWYAFKADVKKEAKIQIPIFDFPGWKVRVDDKAVKISHDNFLGLITVTVPQGVHNLSVRLSNTPIRTFGNFASLASWTLFLLFILQKPSSKKK